MQWNITLIARIDTGITNRSLVRRKSNCSAHDLRRHLSHWVLSSRCTLQMLNEYDIFLRKSVQIDIYPHVCTFSFLYCLYSLCAIIRTSPRYSVYCCCRFGALSATCMKRFNIVRKVNGAWVFEIIYFWFGDTSSK